MENTWLDKVYEDNSVKEPVAAGDWMNGEQAEQIPTDELQRRNYYFAKGDRATKDFLRLMRLEEFKSEVGGIFDELEPSESINLNAAIWADFIKQQFHGDPNLRVPEPFEFANTETEFWTNGFQRRLESVLKAALSWK